MSLMKWCFQRIQQKVGMSGIPVFGSISAGMPYHGLLPVAAYGGKLNLSNEIDWGEPQGNEVW